MLKNTVHTKIDNLISNNIQDMLGQLGIQDNFDTDLSKTQKQAFDLFKKGENVLVLGQAGTGKSKLIKVMEEYNKLNGNGKRLCITSTTGISAYNIGGMTIHSFSGIGTGDNTLPILISKISRKQVYRDRIELTDILIIDEISMLSADLLEKLDVIFKHFRRSKKFFGGVQVVFTGDFNQLLCVFNKNREIYKEIDERLIIESDVFNKEFIKDENIVVLKENFRQKGDPAFINLLGRIRDGTFTEQDITLLESRKIVPIDTNHIHIVSTNKKAQFINETRLEQLKVKTYKYKAIYKSTGSSNELRDILLKELQYQFTLKGIHELVLKKGLRVMLIKNLDVSLGLVNGALGTIIEMQDKYPLVSFDNGETHLIDPVEWEISIDGCKAISTQIPLMLAYACTVHKIQGCTIDSAIIDIEDAFLDHQVYVAISRVKTLNGLYFKSFNSKKIKVNKKTTEYLNNL